MSDCPAMKHNRSYAVWCRRKAGHSGRHEAPEGTDIKGRWKMPRRVSRRKLTEREFAEFKRKFERHVEAVNRICSCRKNARITVRISR